VFCGRWVAPLADSSDSHRHAACRRGQVEAWWAVN